MALPPLSYRTILLLLFVLISGCGGSSVDNSRVGPGNQAKSYLGPIIDMHTHLIFTADVNALNANMPATLEVLETELAKANVGMAGLITIAPKGEPERMRTENDNLVALAKKHPAQFFAIASVHPDDGEIALQEVDRLAQLGVKAIKLHPNAQNFDVASPTVDAVLARAASVKMTVLFDGYSPFDANQLGKFLRLAVSHPDATIILAHMGGPRFAELATLIGVMRRYPWYRNNLWVDVSAMASFYEGSPFADQFLWAARKIGVDRVLFGSDFPIGSMSEAVLAVRRLGFDENEQKAIFFDNAARLFQISAP